MPNLAGILKEFLLKTDEYEQAAADMHTQVETIVREQIYPEISPFLADSKFRRCNVSIKRDEVEILFDAPEIYWIYDESNRSGTGIIRERKYYQQLNQKLHNLFDEVGGRYGVKILGFGKREWGDYYG